jgi:ABC-type glycerol-3-phosphate transport system substrate-binding protein
MKIIKVRAVVFDQLETFSYAFAGTAMKQTAQILLLFLLFSTYAWAQSPKSTSITELATYTGADREQLLYAGAKSEGTVTLSTSLAGDFYKAIARAFEAKYPGVRVESYRAGGSELVVRMAEEAKGHRPTFNALETPAIS